MEYKFEKYGVEGLKESSTWKRYSKELKTSCSKGLSYQGNIPLREITRKYEIIKYIRPSENG